VSASPITKWLEKLGLGQYAQRFVENGIDVSVLRYLTDQDLKKIGVLLGHRRKILAAIAELSSFAQAPPQSTLTTPKPQDTAERRQVTVMFSDLVGSTALSTRMDPEDLREAISAYQKCVAETVQRFGGFVAKYMGDGVLAYFGSLLQWVTSVLRAFRYRRVGPSRAFTISMASIVLSAERDQ
jgi:class 3 adenylate cyclase